jgi:hypothetical protein
MTTLALVAILFTGTALRMLVATRDLDSPLKDENEVVEQAVAFMGGELRYHFLKYGPFSMYVLAGIYRLVAMAHGLDALEYASRVFFEGFEHYFIARASIILSLSVLAVFVFRSFYRHSGVAAALFACSLLALPFVERISKGARIDIPQAALQTGALLALGEAARGRRLAHWALAGACAGFAIATKPLPGLLIAPSFLLASWFASAVRDGTPRRWPARVLWTLGGRGLWLAAATCVGCAVLGNPAMLEVGRFVKDQTAALSMHSGDVQWSTQSVDDSALLLGVPFVAALGLSAFAALWVSDRRALLYASFIVVYVSAFWGRASRDYYMVAPAVAGCLLIAQGFAILGRRALRATPAVRRLAAWSWVPLTAVIVTVPALEIVTWGGATSRMTIATRWVHEHVPDRTRLFYVGQRPAGPRLVATNRKLQSRWGDHFDYGRDKYAFLKEAFELAYDNYERSGRPIYSIEVYNKMPTRRSNGKTPRWVTDGLVKRAREKKQSYIILCDVREKSMQDLDYRWFDEAELVQQFRDIAIFKVPEHAAEPSPS